MSLTREDIVRMALEAKSCVKTDCNGIRLIADGLDIERFAELVAASAVRETSAEYRMGWNAGEINGLEHAAFLVEDSKFSQCFGERSRYREELAAAIRARK